MHAASGTGDCVGDGSARGGCVACAGGGPCGVRNAGGTRCREGGDRFGFAIALDGNRLVVGADFGTGNGFGFAIIPLPDTRFISAPWWKFEGEASGVVLVRGMPPVCGDREPTIFGTNGDDEIYGTPGDDEILPGTGDDIIHGSGGQDVYCLEDGDYRFVGPIGDTRSGPEGMEVLITTVPTPKWRGPEAD